MLRIALQACKLTNKQLNIKTNKPKNIIDFLALAVY